MRVYTKIVIDTETGNVSRATFYDYFGPVALCDRSLQDQAKNAEQTAAGAAGNYGAAGQQVQQNLVPRLEAQAVNPEGYGTLGLGEMETGALSTAGAATGAAQEAAKLRQMRTGNAGGAGATIAASAGESARAGGGALQSILAKNAELKATQQQQANQGLEGILGQDIKGQGEEAGLVPKDIDANLAAQKEGWLQNTQGVLGTLSELGGGAAGAYAKLYGGGK